MGLTWKDADEIAWALADQYPEQDPLRLSFPALRRIIVSLVDFADDPDAANEAILERVQMAWYEEKRA